MDYENNWTRIVTQLLAYITLQDISIMRVHNMQITHHCIKKTTILSSNTSQDFRSRDRRCLFLRLHCVIWPFGDPCKMIIIHSAVSSYFNIIL